MRYRSLSAVLALVVLAGALSACDDEALNEFGAPGASETMLTIELHDGWIGSPEATAGGADGALTEIPIHPHNDVSLQIVNVGAEPHGFALYADQDGTELLVAASTLAPGASEVVTYHFHDPQIAYFFDDANREQMRGELHVYE